MQLWQLDVMGGLFLTSGAECKLVTGVDDHSRFLVIAAVIRRATGLWHGEMRVWDNEVLMGWYVANEGAVRSKGMMYFTCTSTASTLWAAG